MFLCYTQRMTYACFRLYHITGTHDVQLAIQILEGLQKLSSAESTNVNQTKLKKPTVSIPCYDKAAFNGEGDRLDEWNTIECPIDIVLLEGWFLGKTLTTHRIVLCNSTINVRTILYQ